MLPIRAARPDELALIKALLNAVQLPLDGLEEPHVSVLVAWDEDSHRIVGCAGIEEYGDGVLLRSVAVESPLQGTGVGSRLTTAALDLARSRGHRFAYLLTTTAERFFPRFGFAPIDRGSVPATLAASIEFVSACPASAVAMRAPLWATAPPPS